MEHAKGHANVVLWTIKVVVQKFNFISMNCDEVAIVNNQSWLFMNVHVTRKWKRLPILLNLQYEVSGATLDNLIAMIVQNLVKYGRLSSLFWN
jgi:hypothetical protein